MHTCMKCGEVKAAHEFYQRNGKLRSPCKGCEKAAVVCWRASNRERRNGSIARYYADHPDAHERSLLLARRRNLAKWRLTIEAYEVMLSQQDNGCAICGSRDPGGGRTNFCVDHDHACCPGQSSCGRCVRGLLCLGCNRALGLFKDDPAACIAAALYLREKISC